MDADYYLETIRTVFQEFKLVRGTWEVKNPKGELELVRPQDITTTALLTIEGELDDISGSGQTQAAHDLCTQIPKSRSRHMEAQGAGHYGIFSGRRWRDVVYPCVRAFILENNQDGPAAPAKKRVANAAKKVVSKAAAPKAKASTRALTAKKATPRSASARSQSGRTARA
ncbi:MAG: polyhydroxyalkanoate depolymerase [Pseudomonadota bacterium]